MSNEDKISASEMRAEPSIQEFHPLLSAIELRTSFSNNILI